jgi:putative phosphoribosyl transferase
VIELNAAALDAMHCTRKIAIVPGAGHLFEKRGTLDQVVELATDWLVRHLGARR